MQHSGYIIKAACRGYRPRRYASYKEHRRPHLISRLAKDRTVARFIVAPAGYGKTGLVIEYAETMFAWTHVFCLNAKSPCFIRDLDDGDLARECLATDGEAKLVIIEDLPQLGAERARHLSCEIDALIDRGCEVVVTCAPSCDLLGGLQRDRWKMGPADLLLSDEELDALRTEDERSRCPASQVSAAYRVPALVWDAHLDAASDFVAQNLGEDLPADLLLALCSAFVLRRGTLSDLERLGPINRRFVEDALCDYPHVDFNGEDDGFEAPEIAPEAIARALKGSFDAVVKRSAFETKSELVCAWASVLMDEPGMITRACDVICAMSPSSNRAAWALQNARDIMRGGCFYPAHCLMSSLKKGSYSFKDRVSVFNALCLRMLGDEEGAIQCAKKYGFDGEAHADAQAISLLLTARFAHGTLQDKAESFVVERAKEAESRGEGALAWYEALLVAWSARKEGVASLGALWQRLRSDGIADDDMLCVIASWLFDAVEDGEADYGPEAAESLEEAERFIRAHLVDEDAVYANFFAASAGLSLEQAHMRGLAFFDGPLQASILLVLRRVEMATLSQRRLYEQAKMRERIRAGESALDGVAAALAAAPPVERNTVPLLEVRTFGKFDIAIGGTPLSLSRLKRTRTRLLLALLAANQGRDLPIDSIASAMWPESDGKMARKSFYTIWSQLRRGLTLSDGTCPYLIRHQFGCRLDERYVRSDIARLDDICRELLFGRLDFDTWLDLYSEIDRDYSGEFMPAESENALIAKTRVDCRARLVDALVAATLRLIDAGGAQWGIWFARSAIDHEKTREDAYVALMRAQIAYGQRTAAMMTYHVCRRVLAEELGIDPSPETTALYESLLE